MRYITYGFLIIILLITNIPLLNEDLKLSIFTLVIFGFMTYSQIYEILRLNSNS